MGNTVGSMVDVDVGEPVGISVGSKPKWIGEPDGFPTGFAVGVLVGRGEVSMGE